MSAFPCRSSNSYRFAPKDLLVLTFIRYLCERMCCLALYRSALTEQLRDLYDVDDIDDLAKWLSTKWPTFVQKKHLTTWEPEEVGRKFTLIDIACFTDADGKKPRLTVVEGARWEAAPVPGDSATLIFPASFDCVIPAEIGTADNLSYFGCR